MGFWGGREPSHRKLDHFDLGFFRLSSAVHQESYLFVEACPLFGLSAESDLIREIFTMSLRTATEVTCSLLTLAIFSLSRSRSNCASKSAFLLIGLVCYLKTI